jgi:hypothetical protein
MSRDVTLYCLIPPLQGTAVVDIDQLNQGARRYHRNIRRIAGFWDAGFEMAPSQQTPLSYLTQWFENRLGFGFQDRLGGAITYAGIIWEMEFAQDGRKARRDYGRIFNATKVLYIDTDGNEQNTSWYTNDASIAQYGRRELIIPLDNVATAVAEAKAQDELVKSAYPPAETIGLGGHIRDGLNVTAAGLAFTANNRYVTAGDGTDGNVSAYIQEIIETDCDFLKVGRIQENTLQVVQGFDGPIRAWDALVDLTDLGDGAIPFVIYVDADGYCHYHQADATPLYEWRGKSGGGLTTRLGGGSAWGLRPGVVRDLTRPSSKPVPGSFLTDGRDEWVAEIQMADGQDEASLIPDGFDPSDIERAVERNKRWLEQAAEEAAAAGVGS